MEHIPLIGTVTIIHLFAVISPGPDFVMAVNNSVSYSRAIGIWTAIGFGLGISVHIFYCIAGIAILVSRYIIVFNVIKLSGAVYLIYMGIRSIITKSSNIEVDAIQEQDNISSLEAVKIGFLTNVLNPKATLFFLSLFTLVIYPDTPNMILIILSLIMIGNTIIWFTVVAIFFTHDRILSIFNNFQGVIRKSLGGLLIVLGIKVAFSHNT